MKNIGFLLMIVAFLFAISETVYFGNKLLPKSNSEYICDIIKNIKQMKRYSYIFLSWQ